MNLGEIWTAYNQEEHLQDEGEEVPEGDTFQILSKILELQNETCSG